MSECSRCENTNPDEARFCMHCGNPLDRDEARKAPLTPTGAALEATGENRIVTVLFADIAGSTRLAESLGAEPWHNLLNEFFAALTGVIERWGGTVNQYTGDGLMSLFGAPRALEDHAQRACHAALEAQQRLEALGDRVRLEHGQNFGVRIGLNSGPVVVGAIADDWRRDYTAQGATVHLAARMEQMARPGGVYVAESTAQQTEGYFRFRQLGPTQVKGMQQPIVVAELQGLGSMKQRLERSQQRGLSPLVGRAEALQSLQDSWERARVGAGEVVLLQGDAGLGKSRLCMEALARWQNDGATQLRCGALSHGDAQPLAPVKAMLARWLGVSPDADTEDAKRAVAGSVMLEHPELGDALPILLDFLEIEADPRAGAMPPDARKRRLDGLHEQFCKAFCGRRVVLWVDDWHWLDRATLGYLQDWLPHLLAGANVLVLITTRPVELPAWLLNLKLRQVPLLPLTEANMQDLVRQLLGDWVAGHALETQLIAQAEGNPYFIEEAIAHLVDQGVLTGPQGQRRLSDATVELRLPQSVQALLAARLDAASPGQRQMLEAAALVGREFGADWVAAILERPTAEVEAELHRLADGGFVFQRDSKTGWRFMHGLLQEAALQLQLESQRQQRHRRLAEWLRGRIEAAEISPTTWPQVAQHFAAAAAWMEASQANLMGGIKAPMLSVEEAICLLNQALEQLGNLPASETRDVQEFRILMALLRAATFHRFDVEAVTEWRNKAENYLHRYDDPAGQVEFWMSTGIIALNEGNAEHSVKQIHQGIALARETGDETLLSRFRVPILFAHLSRGEIRAGLQVLDKHQGQAWHEGPMNLDSFMSRGFRSLLLAASGEIQAARRELEAAIRFCEAEAIPVSWMYANLAEIRLFQGDIEGLPELALKAVRVAADFGSPVFDEVAHRAQAQVLLATGDAEAAYAQMRHWSSAVAPGGSGEIFAAAHHEVLANIAHAAGDEEAAAQAAEHAIATADNKGQMYWAGRARLARLRIGSAPQRGAEDRAEVVRLAEVTGAKLLLLELERLEAGAVA